MTAEATRPAGQLPHPERPRVDLREKVTGAAEYVDDVPDLPGVAYAAAIHSPYSHARIVSIDSSSARSLPGVLEVLDKNSLGEYDVHLPAETSDNPFITTDVARFDGDLVGMVAAEDMRTAHAAAALVEVEWDILEPIFSHGEAFTPGAVSLHEDAAGNVALRESLEWGDVERGLAEADYVYEGTFTSPTIYHHPIEPTMSVMVSYTTEGVEIWVPTNNPFDVAKELSHLFSIGIERIRVHVPYVGGNFGAKHGSRELMAAAAMSMRLGRPVKYIASEEESFRVTARHAMDYKAKVGAKRDGTITALDVELSIDTGAYFTGARIATNNAVNAAWGGYRLPNFRVQASTAYTTKVPAAMFRNTGKNQTTFGVDAAVDSVARHLGIPPFELRAKNLLKRGETITHKNWKRNGKEEDLRIPLMDTDYVELMERAVAAIGWDGRTAGPIPVEGHPNRFRGRGMAVSVRRGASLGTATARATLEPDGSVTITHNAPDVGEGAHTMISVVAARALGLPQDRVNVSDVDTQNQLMFSGTSSQRTTVQMGNAVRSACERLKQELCSAAAGMQGGAPDAWRVEDGQIRREGVSLSFVDVAGRLASSAGLSGEGKYEPGQSVRDLAFGDHDHWAPGVAAVEVEVDRETGDVRVLQYAAVADAGTILHASSARGQIEGGAVMGFGATLFEELHYQEGQLMNADAFQYRLPQMGDIPDEFNTIIVEHGDGPGPFGSKGIAQTSIPCVAPSISNAIYDAVGVRLTTIPFSPEKILQGLGVLTNS